MKLSSLLTESQIILDLQSEEHIPAIEELVEHLDTIGMLTGEAKDDALVALHAREDQISTGIGSGVAIPHAFSDKVDNVIAIFGRSLVGVDFEALDNAPVKFILLFVVPKKDYNMHLQTLAAIAKLFNNCEVRKQMELAESREEILAIFGSRPSRIATDRVFRMDS